MAGFKVIFIADVVGKPGRYILSQMTKRLQFKYDAAFTIANVENAAGGFGITPEMAKRVFAYGVDCQTSGNHIWDRNGIGEYMNKEPRIIRPANYPPGAPGRGYYVTAIGGVTVAVVNLMGRTFMYHIDCPFRTADDILDSFDTRPDIIIVDIHAEATSEKEALAYYLDGRVSAVVGTHTHVQTADESISARGVAYITDVGMTGSFDSILGMRKGPALDRFLTGMPKRLSVAEDDVRISGVIIEFDMQKHGWATAIERFCLSLDLSMPLKNPYEEIEDAGEAD
jgi:metallophosphoesterase (TIGR00282 family)